MDVLLETLDKKLRTWPSEKAQEVRAHVEEIIQLADQDALDLLRSRCVEQEVLDLLDEPQPR